MNVNDFNILIKQFKSKGSVLSNYNASSLSYDNQIAFNAGEKAAVISISHNNVCKNYFAFVNDAEGINEFCELMKDVPEGSTVDWLQKGAIDDGYCVEPEEYDSCNIKDFFTRCGLELYKKYIRITTTYTSNPKLLPEVGRRTILYEMYEPGGEWASIKDAEELCRINSDTFDPLTDDVFSLEEWKRIISNKECLVHRDDGEITAYYVWKLEGKKLYSNIAFNCGPANHLYNIERRVFEYYWDMGIRTFYAWFDIKNKDALKRHNTNCEEKEIIRNRSVLYNYVYKK